MAEQRDTSLLFSLDSIMERERERVLLEHAEAERRAAMERVERMEKEKRALRLELARQRQRDRALELEGQRLREEAVRLEQLRQAELERSLMLAAARSESEIAARRNAHERQLSEVAFDTAKSRLRVIAWSLCGALTVSVAGFGWFYVSYLGPERRRAEAAFDAVISAERARAEETRGLVDAARAKTRALEAELAAVERARSTPSVASSIPGASALPRKLSSPAPAKAVGKTRSANCKDDGDPLNPCLR